MGDILRQVDKSLDKKDKIISLEEIEASFDNIAKSVEDQKKLVTALDENLTKSLLPEKKGLEKVLSKKIYTLGFDYKDTIKDMIEMDKDLSKMDEKNIKVYQLCKNLELKKAGIDKHIEINGKVGPELIYDRVKYYKEQGIGLIAGTSPESLIYDPTTNELTFTTQFGESKKSLKESTAIVDNLTSSKCLVADERQTQFSDFLTTNAIAAQDFETMTLSDDKVITMTYKNKTVDMNENYTLNITAGLTNDVIIKFVEKSRLDINSQKAVAEEKNLIKSMPGSLLDLAKKGDKIDKKGEVSVRIEVEDFEAALKDGFFDKQINIDGIIKELDTLHPLKKTFLTSLKVCKDDIVAKNTENLTSAEIKLLQLYANYKLGEKFKVDGKISTQLSEVMALPNNKYVEHIQNILLKDDKRKVSSFKANLGALDLDENTIVDLTLDDITKFIDINLDDYTVEQQGKILLNIQHLLLDWNSLFPNKKARVNSATLIEIKTNYDFQKETNRIYDAMVLDKEKFKEGTVSLDDFKKYQPIDARTNKPMEWTKYDGNAFYPAFKKLLVALCPSSGTSVDLTPLYKNRATKGTTFLKSDLFRAMENRSEDAGGTLEVNKGNIWQTLYYEFVGYAVKDVLAANKVSIATDDKKPPTKVTTQVIDEDYYRGYNKKELSESQKYIFASTTYGKSLQSASDVRYIDHFGDNDKQKIYDTNKVLIKECTTTITTLEKEALKRKELYEDSKKTVYEKNGTVTTEVNGAALNKYQDACSALIQDGNRAFLAMILQSYRLGDLPEDSLNSLGSPTLIALIKQHYAVYSKAGTAGYTGVTSLPAPIKAPNGEEAGYMIDYTLQKNEVRTSSWKMMAGAKAKSYAGDPARVKAHVDCMIRDTVLEHVEDKMIEIEKNPGKFFIDVGVIVGAGLITGLTGGGVLLSAGIFLASTKALGGIVSGIEYVNKGGNFIEGLGKGTGVLDQGGKFVGRSNLIENTAWEYATNLILFGPVGKLGHVAERGALTLLEKQAAIEGTESLITKFGLETAGAKTFGLLSEAGIFTGFNAVMGSARKGFSEDSWKKAMSIDDLAGEFVHNIMFISALKLGNFATSGFQEKLAGKQLTNASKTASLEVETLKKSFDVEIEKMKTEDGIEPKEVIIDGASIIKFVKDGKALTEAELSAVPHATAAKAIQTKLIAAQDALVNIQVQITTKTQEFTSKTEVKKYNDFLDDNDLRREILTPENIIDLRIQAAEKTKDLTKVKELTGLREELKTSQKEYNIVLNATIKANQDIAEQKKTEDSAQTPGKSLADQTPVPENRDIDDDDLLDPKKFSDDELKVNENILPTGDQTILPEPVPADKANTTTDNTDKSARPVEKITQKAETEEQTHIEAEMTEIEEDLSTLKDLSTEQKIIKGSEITKRIDKIVDKLQVIIKNVSKQLKSLKTDLSTLKSSMEFLDRCMAKLHHRAIEEMIKHGTGHPISAEGPIMSGSLIALTEIYKQLRINYKTKGGELDSTDFDDIEKYDVSGKISTVSDATKNATATNAATLDQKSEPGSQVNDISSVTDANKIPGEDDPLDIEILLTQKKQEITDLLKENNLDEKDPDHLKEIEKNTEKLTSIKSGLKIIENAKREYIPELIEIQEALKKDPNNAKLLAEQKAYKKIQTILETGANINIKMTTIETIKTKINILKMNIQKLGLSLKSVITSGNTKPIYEKIDLLKEKVKKLQAELDIHEADIKSLFLETYQGLKNLKGLTDSEILAIGKVYNEYVLKPVGFRTIDYSATFGPDMLLDSNGNTLEIDSEFKNTSDRTLSGADTKVMSSIKETLYKISEDSDITSVSTQVQTQIDTMTNLAEKEMAQKLWDSMESKVKDSRLLPSEKAVIFSHSLLFMADYKSAYPTKTASEVFLLMEANQNKLMHQHVQDKSYLTGSSHDILHILKGNMDMAEKFMKNMSTMERVITRQIIIDHDIGYTSMFNKYLNTGVKEGSKKYFDATKDYPIRSTIFIEENAERYKKNFGDDGYAIIKNGVLTHSKAKTTDLPSTVAGETYTGEVRPEIIYGVTSVVDCSAASTDYKTAFLFGQPEIAAQFRLVYESMAVKDFLTAEKNLLKIVDIVKDSSTNPALQTALLEALDSMSLKPDADGTIPLQIRLQEIESLELEQGRDEIIKKANKNDKNLEKVLKTFNKANSTDIKTITALENMTQEQMHNYLKFEYIDDITSFPYQKYLAQYGTRISVDDTGAAKLGSYEAKVKNKTTNEMETKNVVTAEFELAGTTFESLVKMGGAKFALGSFIKVCDDFNINQKDPQITVLIDNIQNAYDTGNLTQGLKDIYPGASSVTIMGPNGEKITLNFEGKSYKGIDETIEAQTTLNEHISEETKNMETAFTELRSAETLEQKKTLVADMKTYIGDISDVVGTKSYVVKGTDLSSYDLAVYCKQIQTKMDTYFSIEGKISEDHINEILADIENISETGYFPSLFLTTKN